MMRPEQLADGVWRIPTFPLASINGALLASDDGLTLVDPGLRITRRVVERALVRLGFHPRDLTRIVITHAHLDHAGAVARLARSTGARVYAHADDVPFLAAGRSPDRIQVGYPVVGVDQTLADGEVVAGLRVVHTPGHTPGHVSLLHEPSGVLIVGDALINPLYVRYPIRWFCSDLAAMRRSAAGLAELDFETAAFAHGPPIRLGARREIRDALAKRARR